MSDGWEAFLKPEQGSEQDLDELEAFRASSRDEESSSPGVARSQQSSDPAYVRLLKEHTREIETGGIARTRPLVVVSACTAACAEAAVLQHSCRTVMDVPRFFGSGWAAGSGHLGFCFKQN